MKPNQPNASAPNVKEWYETEFLPWQAKASAYRAEKAAQQQALRRHLPALQTMVGLLMEGQTRRAVLAWNSLGLSPALSEIILSKNGDEILLRTKGGTAEHIALEDVIAGLEALVAETTEPSKQATEAKPQALPSPEKAAAS